MIEKIIKITIVLLSLLMVGIMIYANIVEAADWQVKGSHYKTISSDPELIVQSGYGYQLSLHKNNVYLYLSKDTVPLRFGGQGAIDLNLWSAGIGMQRKIKKYLILSFDAGWYEPRHSKLDEPQPYGSSPFAEGLCRYVNKFLIPDDGYPAWEYYKLNYFGAIGGELNLEFEYPFTKKMSLNISTGYRYLKLFERVSGEDYDGGWARLGEEGSWQVKKDRDFSSWQIGLNLSYAF